MTHEDVERAVRTHRHAGRGRGRVTAPVTASTLLSGELPTTARPTLERVLGLPCEVRLVVRRGEP